MAEVTAKRVSFHNAKLFVRLFPHSPSKQSAKKEPLQYFLHPRKTRKTFTFTKERRPLLWLLAANLTTSSISALAAQPLVPNLTQLALYLPATRSRKQKEQCFPPSHVGGALSHTPPGPHVTVSGPFSIKPRLQKK